MVTLIGSRPIGIQYPPFLIAELSANHNQSLDRALAIVEAAAKAGAHAFKLQTYTAETMTLDVHEREFLIADPKSLWAGRTLYNLYEEAHTPWEWHQPIFDRVVKLGMIPFSTAFDESSVDFLEQLNVQCHKVASFEITHLPLIKKAASTGKPLFLSTGMASEREIREAVEVARRAGCQDLILLKCTSAYPATPSDANLRTIAHMRATFRCNVGVSDHSLGIGVSISAVAQGAVVIEKHFTLDRKDGGLDSEFSIDPAELGNLVVESKRAWEALGSVRYGVTNSEKNSTAYRRSIYTTKNIKVGEKLTRNNIRIVRPGYGLPPKYFDRVLSCEVVRDISAGTPLDWDSLLIHNLDLDFNINN